jgi:hypothetical protein
MTAEDTGRTKVDLGLVALARLREHWLAVAFVLGGLFWARDTWVALTRLPPLVEVQGERIVLLESRMEALADSLSVATCGGVYPDGHRIEAVRQAPPACGGTVTLPPVRPWTRRPALD